MSQNSDEEVAKIVKSGEFKNLEVQSASLEEAIQRIS